jgi:ribosomal protein L16 Arg81 hydroxylase
LTNYAFGLPTNINIYITPPGAVVSVPPHTDRQDVLVFQTEGSKRWRVYGPPKRIKGKDPLNRGKGGDVIEKKELGNPILDVVLRRGDGKFCFVVLI